MTDHLPSYNGFSELCDRIVELSGRENARGQIVAYLNQTIKECSVKQFFYSDMVEDELTADANPYIWTLPARFRKLRTALYSTQGVYPKNYPPGRHQFNEDHYYYGADNYIAFKGVSENGETIKVAYYAHPKMLKYYKSINETGRLAGGGDASNSNYEDRPARYNLQTEAWEYLVDGAYTSTLGSTALNEAAQAKVSNWLVFRWPELLVEGTLAKIHKLFGDDRSLAAYALYKELQSGFIGIEAFESIGG